MKQPSTSSRNNRRNGPCTMIYIAVLLLGGILNIAQQGRAFVLPRGGVTDIRQRYTQLYTFWNVNDLIPGGGGDGSKGDGSKENDRGSFVQTTPTAPLSRPPDDRLLEERFRPQQQLRQQQQQQTSNNNNSVPPIKLSYDEQLAYIQEQIETIEAERRRQREGQDQVLRGAALAATALGTAAALNGVAGGDLSARAEAIWDNLVPDNVALTTTQVAAKFSSSWRNAVPEVTLPYLEEKIRAAEEALMGKQMQQKQQQQQNALPSFVMASEDSKASTPPAGSTGNAAPIAAKVVEASSAAATVVPKVAAATPVVPKAADSSTTAALVVPKVAEASSAAAPVVPKPAQATSAAAPVVPKVAEASSAAAPVVPKPAQATSAPAPVVPKPAEATSAAAPVVPKVAEASAMAPKVVAATVSSPPPTQAAPTPAKVASTPVPVQSKPATVAANKPVAKAAPASSVVGQSPSLLRYTQEKFPVWVETGKQIYRAVEPKVVQAGQALAKEVDKRVTPRVVEAERQILGEENAARLDRTLAGVVAAGKVVYSAVEFVAPYIVEGGIQVIKATPEVIKAGRQVYETVDKKVIPEVVETGRKVKLTVDRELPKVQAASRQMQSTVETTIKPEVDAAAKRFSSTVLPRVMDAERIILPELTIVERMILGAQNADKLDGTISDVMQQSRYVLDTVDKNVLPEIVSTTKTVAGAAATATRTLVETGSAVCETGKAAKGTVERSLPGIIATAQDVATELDRAGGYVAYAIDGKMPGVVETIDKAIPEIIETGRQVQQTLDSTGKKVIETMPQIIETMETGARFVESNLLKDDQQKVKTFTFLAGAGVASVVAAAFGRAQANNEYDVDYRYSSGSGSANGISDNSRGFPSIFPWRNNDDDYYDELYERSSSRSSPSARARSRRFTR